MKPDELLDSDTQIVETFSNCDSFDNLTRFSHGDPSGVPDGEIETEEPAEETENCENNQQPRGNHTQPTINCQDLGCRTKMAHLEKMIRLLESQNAQLIVNMCAMYNTMVQYIETLEKTNE